MSSNNDSGLMSSAGLVRYFDSDDKNAIQIKHKTIVAAGILFGVFIQMIHLFV